MASKRWSALCERIGQEVAAKLEGCEERIGRAVVDLEQSQATFGASVKFRCGKEGDVSATIECSEPKVRLDPVEMKLGVTGGQIGLFEGKPAGEDG